MSAVDFIIRNGRVIDPANNVDTESDIAIRDGYIVSIGPKLQMNSRQEFDATGCLVTPGLIDCHVHCYQYATPLGINPDERCLARTWRDYGGRCRKCRYVTLAHTPPPLCYVVRCAVWDLYTSILDRTCSSS